MIISKKGRILLSSITILVLAGCSVPFPTTTTESFNNSIDEVHNKDNDQNTSLDGLVVTNLDSKYKNEERENNFFVISHSITLESALQKLGNIDKRQYFLHSNMENIILPPNNIKIYSFGDLQNYIEDVMEKTIFVSKNAVLKNRIKIVEVIDIRAKDKNLKKVRFLLNGSMSVKEALKYLSTNKDFKFSISIDNDDFENEKSKKIFEDIYLNFKGDNVQEFFSYLEKKLNIYIIIDYKNNIVTFTKYAKKSFTLMVPNVNMQIDSSASDTKVTEDAGEAMRAVKETKEMNIYKELELSFDKIIEESKLRGSKNSYYIFDLQTGNISVNADKRTLTAFSDLINKTNDAYKDMIEVTVTNFEVAFDKDFNFGTDFRKVGHLGTFNSPASLAKTIFSSKSAGIADKDGFLLNAIQGFGHLVDKQKDRFILRNHIPDSNSELLTERYLKNIVRIDPVNLGDTTKQATETDIVKQPNSYNVTAHYKNGLISINLKTSKGQILSIDQLGEGEYAVSNPKTKSTETMDNIVIKSGESFVTSSKIKVKKANSYSGILPTDWIIANMIGGKTDSAVIYTQTITIITAKKINNL